MEGIILVLIVLAIVCFGSKASGGSGGVIVKDNPASKKPKIGGAPQGIRPKKSKKK